MARPILWASLPTALPAVGELGEKAVVYYCGDDFSALAGVDHGPVLEMEQRLVEKADLILAASPTLAARFPSNKTKFLPHGADIDLFATPTPRAVDLPMDRPVAGFYGSLSGWIDVALLGRVAQSLPDWWVVLIGDVRTDVSAIARLDNVRLLGPRPHDALPSYSQHWTASLLPFRDCPQITACNPLKLREYLAAGRPVVSTPFPALAPYGGVVMQAESAGAFVGCLRQSLDDDARNVSARRAAIAGETWEARAAMVNHALRIL